MSRATTKQGEVIKRNHDFLHTWSDRFMVLMEDKLAYYKTKEDYEAGKKPQNTVEPLSRCKVFTTGQCKVGLERNWGGVGLTCTWALVYCPGCPDEERHAD